MTTESVRESCRRVRPAYGGSRRERFEPGHDLYEDVAMNCTDLRVRRIVDGAGHWVQQEAPEEVTATLLDFLASLP